MTDQEKERKTGNKKFRGLSNLKFQDETFDILKLRHRWQKLMGEKFGKVTFPNQIYRGKLTILAQHPLYIDQLQFLARPILEKIHQEFPELRRKVDELNFRFRPGEFTAIEEILQKNVERKELKQRPPKLHPQNPAYQGLRREAEILLKESCQELDEESKERFYSLYVQLKLK